MPPESTVAAVPRNASGESRAVSWKHLLLLAGALSLGACLHRGGAAAVVHTAPAPNPGGRRPAPDFVLLGPGNRGIASKQFRGQPVVVLVAPSPDTPALRKEAGRIEHLYLDLSARRTIFVAAFTAAHGRVVSNVPYIIAADGPAVAKAYGVAGSEFAVIVIGVDGNVDMVSTRVEAAQRILDVINNNGAVQAANRGGLGS